jgi:PilZ domain
MERRRDPRFDIRLKCRVQPVGGQHFIEGLTLNLSRSGALIRMVPNGHPALVPRPGDALWAEVPLPAHRQFKQRCLASKAVAVRISEDKEGWVVALRFERVQFATAKPARSPEDSLAVM